MSAALERERGVRFDEDGRVRRESVFEVNETSRCRFLIKTKTKNKLKQAQTQTL